MKWKELFLQFFSFFKREKLNEEQPKEEQLKIEQPRQLIIFFPKRTIQWIELKSDVHNKSNEEILEGSVLSGYLDYHVPNNLTIRRPVLFSQFTTLQNKIKKEEDSVVEGVLIDGYLEMHELCVPIKRSPIAFQIVFLTEDESTSEEEEESVDGTILRGYLEAHEQNFPAIRTSLFQQQIQFYKIDPFQEMEEIFEGVVIAGRLGAHEKRVPQIYRNVIPIDPILFMNQIRRFDQSTILEYDLDKIVQILIQEVRKNIPIGIALTYLIDNDSYVKEIYSVAQNALKNKSSKIIHQDWVFLALCLIGMECYDSSFWDKVEQTLIFEQSTYEVINAETRLRKIIDAFVEKKSWRKIDNVLRQAFVPFPYWDFFIPYLDSIFKYEFNYDLAKVSRPKLKQALLRRGPEAHLNIAFKSYFEDESKLDELVLYVYELFKWIHSVKTGKGSNHKIQEKIQSILGGKEVNHREKTEIKDRNDSKEKSIDFDFILDGDQICLRIPDFDFDPERYSKSLRIEFFQNNEMIQTVDRLKVVRHDNNYRIRAFEIELEDPFGSLELQIKTDEHLLFSSGESLYHSRLYFDEFGKNVSNVNSLEGQFIVAGIDLQEDESVHIDQEFEMYDLGTICLEKRKKVVIQLYGNQFLNVHIKDSLTTYPIYRSIYRIEPEEDGFYLRNGHRYENIQELLDSFEEGLNVLEFFQDKRKMAQKKVFYEPGLSISLFEDSYVIDGKIIHKDVSKKNVYEIEWYYPNSKQTFWLVLTPPDAIYRIDDLAWRGFEHSIDSDEFKSFSKLYFDGIDFDRVVLMSDDGQFRMVPKIQRTKKHLYIETAALKNNKEYSHLNLFFYKEQNKENMIRIQYRPEVDQRSIQIQTNHEKREAFIQFELLKDIKNNEVIVVQLLDPDNNALRTKTIEANAKTLNCSFEHLESFRPYRMRGSIQTKSLFSKQEETFLFLRDIPMLYGKDNLKRKQFNVDSVQVEYFRRNGWKIKNYDIQNTLLEVKKQKEEIYQANLLINEEYKNKICFTIQEVKEKELIILPTDLDGDGLMLNQTAKTITEDQRNAFPIFQMKISLIKNKINTDSLKKFKLKH